MKYPFVVGFCQHTDISIEGCEMNMKWTHLVSRKASCFCAFANDLLVPVISFYCHGKIIQWHVQYSHGSDRNYIYKSICLPQERNRGKESPDSVRKYSFMSFAGKLLHLIKCLLIKKCLQRKNTVILKRFLHFSHALVIVCQYPYNL